MTPDKNNKVEITSACVGCNPRKLIRLLTLIFSIKNRSIPFKMRYKANNVPGILNFFRTDHIIRNSKKQAITS